MSDTIACWRAAVEAGDAHAAASALADGVELSSPLTDQFMFRGRAEVEELLASVFQVFTAIKFTSEQRIDSNVALRAEGRVDGLRLQESQHLELDTHGQICRIALMMRPLASVTRFQRRLGPSIARRQDRPVPAALLTIGGAFLDFVAAHGDKTLVPLARPRKQQR